MFSDTVLRSIDANRTIKDKIVESISRSRPRLRISVTDLTNPMQAYFRWVHPEIKTPIDKLQYMLLGTGFHDIFSDIVTTEEYVEQLLEYDGIVGKVDIFENIPIELKTTNSIPNDLYKEKLSYVEQLGMYCAMADCDKGQLIIYKRGSGTKKVILKVFDVTYFDLAKIKSSMSKRKDMFQNALESKNPDKLPRCEWYQKRCDYAKFCRCETANSDEPIVGNDEVEISSNENALEQFTNKLLSKRISATDTNLTLDNIIFPRKYALSRNHSEIATNGNNFQTQMANIENLGFRKALLEAIKFGSEGKLNYIKISKAILQDTVLMLSGIPIMVETVEMDTMIPRKELPSIFPHYFDKLAFICALTNSPKSRLILYYQNIYKNKFMIYDVIFKNRNEILQEFDKRLDNLINNTDHTMLPKCPKYIVKYCQYSTICECG